MDTETLTIQSKGDDFEIIVQHDQSGSAYGITLSKDTFNQLKKYFLDSYSEGHVECSNCGENVKMIITGEICPNCLC